MRGKTVVLNGAKVNYDGAVDYSVLAPEVTVYDLSLIHISHAGHHVLALGVDQVLAHQLLLAGGGVAGKGHARARQRAAPIAGQREAAVRGDV